MGVSRDSICPERPRPALPRLYCERPPWLLMGGRSGPARGGPPSGWVWDWIGGVTFNQAHPKARFLGGNRLFLPGGGSLTAGTYVSMGPLCTIGKMPCDVVWHLSKVSCAILTFVNDVIN